MTPYILPPIHTGTYVRDTSRLHPRKSPPDADRKDLTIDEISERLGISRQTIAYWVTDLPLKKEPRWNPHVAAAAMKSKHQLAREAAYEEGRDQWDSLAEEASFRDFICMYMGEGYKRSRNTVALSNSDPDVIVLAARWIRRLTSNQVIYEVQHHADQEPDELRAFWSRLLDVPADAIRLFPKSNSGQLRSRTWRCRHGVMAVKSHDTLFRARLQAWMDRLRMEWLDSAA